MHIFYEDRRVAFAKLETSFDEFSLVSISYLRIVLPAMERLRGRLNLLRKEYYVFYKSLSVTIDNSRDIFTRDVNKFLRCLIENNRKFCEDNICQMDVDVFENNLLQTAYRKNYYWYSVFVFVFFFAINIQIIFDKTAKLTVIVWSIVRCIGTEFRESELTTAYFLMRKRLFFSVSFEREFIAILILAVKDASEEEERDRAEERSCAGVGGTHWVSKRTRIHAETNRPKNLVTFRYCWFYSFDYTTS